VTAAKAAFALTLALVVLALGACGGDDDDEGAATTAGGAATAPETAGGDTAGGDTTGGDTGGAVSGEEVFASAGCGNCHTLEAAGSTGSVGPNLDDLQPDTEQVAEQVRNGGGGMPAFEGELSDAEIEAVAEYVSSSAGGGSSASARYP
jgi:cytochrome c6